jgi:hypothetical protein
MVLRLAAILILHKAEPFSWSLSPGSWLLHGAAVCASLLPSVGLRAHHPGGSHAGGFNRGLVAQLVRARA